MELIEEYPQLRAMYEEIYQICSNIEGAVSYTHLYLKMFEDKVFYVALKNNLIFTVMSVICQIGISLVIASVLEAKFMRKAQNFFRSVYFIPSL